MGLPEIKQAHCNNCGGKRLNEVLFAHREHASDSDGARIKLYEVLRCCGCQDVRFCRIEIDTLDKENAEGIKPHVTYYPAEVFRKTPVWMTELLLESIDREDAVFVHDMLQEIYRGLYGAQSLAAMGIRALLEFMMLQNVQDQGTFAKNLLWFHQQGFVSEIDKKHIEAVLEVGHAAIHRGHRPSHDSVVTALDITEGLVKRLYLDEGRVQELRRTVPPRSRT